MTSCDQFNYIAYSLNPGRIDPTNAAWHDSREPLAAVWESSFPSGKGQRFFTVSLHLIAEDESTTVQGKARPPVNLGAAKNIASRVSLRKLLP